MSFLRTNPWVFAIVAASLAAAAAYAFAALEKGTDPDAPRKAAFKTLTFAFLANAALVWFTRTESLDHTPFQE